MGVRDLGAEMLFVVSALVYAIFWIWAIIHALQTPRATDAQRGLWGIAMIANPITAIWYWYVWKRWAFWTLFTPLLGLTFSFPFIIRSIISKADATALTNALFALGSSRQVVLIAALMIFPMLLGLAALLHLGKNTELTAMDRNDWIVSLALPFFGFGAGIAYCARFMRTWAVLGLLWWIVIIAALKGITINISHALIPAGEEKREEFLLRIKPN
ncbi:MAG: hypothetical protein WC787_00630 [Patescibacteria group bacterium]|jgi:hypothetical protein